MITELQKQHVREVVEKILAQIDWPPERLCELAIRAALAVSKSPEGAEFREWAERFVNIGFKEFYYMKRNEIFGTVSRFDKDCEKKAIWFALSTTYNCEYRREVGNDLKNALINAKLAAIARGEKLEISEIVKEMKIQEEV